MSDASDLGARVREYQRAGWMATDRNDLDAVVALLRERVEAEDALTALESRGYTTGEHRAAVAVCQAAEWAQRDFVHAMKGVQDDGA